MFRISLRELLILTALAALCLVSLKFASAGWMIALKTGAILIVFSAIVVAVADRGPRQKFALAFAIVAAGYYFIVVTEPGTETSIASPMIAGTSGRLPTSHLLQSLHQAIAVTDWYNPFTGQGLGPYDPTRPPPGISLPPGGPGGGGGIGPQVRVRPEGSTFMRIGHVWWSLLFGYVGGHFAQFLYVRRATAKE
ncbi:MAG: hypothetical protein WD669_07060 [Pirellulales bacterium]